MPEEYMNASKMQYDDASDTVKEFEKELSQIKGKCLDIGCGPGHVTYNLVLPKLHERTQLVGKEREGSMSTESHTRNTIVPRGRHIAKDDRFR